MIYTRRVYYQILFITIFNGSLWCIELERGCQKTQAFKTNEYVECTHLPKVELPSEVRSLIIQGDLREIDKELVEPISMIQNLNMSNCNINVLKAHNFCKMKLLMTLILTNNNIEFIEEETFSNLKLLTELHIDGNNLKIIIRGSFKETIHLQILNLQNNQLLEIPAELPKPLKTLNLANNDIQYIDTEKLKHLENLQILNLRNNSIFNWPNSLFLPELRYLCLGCSATSPKLLSQTNLAHTNISELKFLEKLVLENYIIDNFNFLSQIKNLKILQFLNITYTRETVILLPSQLMELHLEMSPAIAHILITSDQNLHQLTTLSLKNNNITILGKNEAKRLIKNVRNLDISQNPLICLPSEWGWISEQMKLNKLFLMNKNHTLCNEPPNQKGKPINKILQELNQNNDQRERNKQNERKCDTPENYSVNNGQEMVDGHQFKAINLSNYENKLKSQNNDPFLSIVISVLLIVAFLLFLKAFNKISSKCKTLPEQNINIQYTSNGNRVNI